MTVVFGEMVYGVAARLGIMIEGVATGGSSSTVIDTTATSTKEFGSKIDAFYNGGSVGIINPAGSIVAWEYQEILDSISTTQTLKVQGVFSSTVVNNDRYWVAKKSVPLRLIEQKLNQVLGGWGQQVDDITTITTAANQREYILPLAASLDLRKVERQTNEGDSDNFQWVPEASWEIRRTAIGTADILVLAQQPYEGKLLRLTYFQRHPASYTFSGKLDDTVHLDLIVIRAAMLIIEDRLEVDPRDELQLRWNTLDNALTEAKELWDHRGRDKPQRGPQLNSVFGRRALKQRRRYPGDRNALRGRRY